MCLHETHNSLQLPVLFFFFFFFFFSFFCQLYPEYRWIRSKSYFTDNWKANTNQLFVSMTSTMFGSILLQNKSQRWGIPWRLLDKHCHLFTCISSKQTLSGGQKPVYISKYQSKKSVFIYFTLGKFLFSAD